MRPPAHSRAKQIVVAGLVLSAAIAPACASSSQDESAAIPSSGFGMGGGSKYFVDGGPSRGGQAGGRLNPLCGHDFDCANPDDVLACKGFQGSSRPIDGGNKGAGGASTGGSRGSGGAAPSGGTTGSPHDGAAGEASPPRDGSADGLDASDAADAPRREGGSPVDVSLDRGQDDHSAPALDSGTIGAGGAGNSGLPDADVTTTPDAGPRYSCQIALPPPPPNSGAGGSTSSEPFSQCLPAGDRGSGSPCLSSADCRPGLACAAGLANARNGQCLPYCCDSATSCEKAWVALGGGGPDSGSSLYCGERALVDGSQRPALRVPVCVLPDRCRLGDPYPCTGSLCECPTGTACAVTVVQGDGGNSVRGTTYCAVPGKGRANESCNPAKPCAAGYFCSESRGVCLKMCSTDGFDSTCAPGRCQRAEGFPENWGVCVGPAPAAK